MAITAVRAFAKSWVAAILIGLLVISFAVFGINDVFGGGFSNDVVRAGDRRVSSQMFKLQFDNAKEAMEQQAGQPIPMEDMIARGMHTQFLDSVAEQEGFYAWAWRAGIRPGTQLVVEQIRQVPAFFNQVTGAFDEDQYASLLAREGLDRAMFEQDLRDQFSANHFGAALYAGMRAPRIYGALVVGQGLQVRDGRWFAVTQDMAGRAPAPTDAQLNAFLAENAERLRRPELRQVSMVRFTPAQVADQVEVSEDQIVARFEFRREALSQPETRSFITLSVADRETAARISAALRAGQDVAAVAEANNIEPVEYENRPQSAVTDQQVGAAVFGLPAGAVSEPIQGGLGWTVARVLSVNPGRPATLAETRDAIAQELREEGAREQVFALVERYDEARQNGASLAAAAEQVGVELVELPPLTAEGVMANGQQVPEQVANTAFSLERGGESDIVDAGNSQYFALRLNEITPAALPSLDEVREFLTTQWTARENARLLAAKTDELAGRVRGGEDIAAVAASANAPLVVRTNVRQDEQAQAELGAGVLAGLFGQGVNQVFSGPLDETSFVVGRVDAVRAPVPALAATTAEGVRPQLSMQLVQELTQTARAAAGESVGVEVDEALARVALGLPAEEPATQRPTP